MKKIDELILKILQLNPTKLQENDSYYLFYKDITLYFWNMNQEGLVKINSNDAVIISKETVRIVLKYFKKKDKINDLLNRINKDIRKEKLLLIGDES